MPQLSKEIITKISPFTFLGVKYSYQVGGLFYADTLEAAQKGYAAFQALPDRMRNFYAYQVQTNGMLVCMIDADTCTSDPTKMIFGQWRMISDQERPVIAGRPTDVAFLYDNITIRIAAGKNRPISEIMGTIAHEGEHHYWFNHTLKKAHPNDKLPRFLSDPMALRRLKYQGRHLPRSAFYKAFFEDFRQYLSEHGPEVWLNNEQLLSHSPDFIIFNNPIHYLKRAIQGGIQTEFELPEGMLSGALTYHINKMVLQGESKPAATLMAWLHNALVELSSGNIHEVDRRLRPILHKAWELMRTEIVAHISDVAACYPGVTARYVPNTLAVLEKITKSAQPPRIPVTSGAVSTPLLENSLFSELEKKVKIPSHVPLFTNTHSVGEVRPLPTFLSINPKLPQEEFKTFMYVITAEGQLFIAEPRFTPPYVHHPDLHPGPVAAAGEFYFSNQQWVINNKSGHFLPRGPHIEAMVCKVFKGHGFKNTTFIPVNDALIKHTFGLSELPNNMVFRDAPKVWRNNDASRLLTGPQQPATLRPQAGSIVPKSRAVIEPEVILGPPRMRLPALTPTKPTITLEYVSKGRAILRSIVKTVGGALVGASYAFDVYSEYKPAVYDNPALTALGLGTAKFGAHFGCGSALWKLMRWKIIPFQLATLAAELSPDLEQKYQKESKGLEGILSEMRAKGATLNEVRQAMEDYYQMHPYADPREVGGAIYLQKGLQAVNGHRYIEGAFAALSDYVEHKKNVEKGRLLFENFQKSGKTVELVDFNSTYDAYLFFDKGVFTGNVQLAYKLGDSRFPPFSGSRLKEQNNANDNLYATLVAEELKEKTAAQGVVNQAAAFQDVKRNPLFKGTVAPTAPSMPTFGERLKTIVGDISPTINVGDGYLRVGVLSTNNIINYPVSVHVYVSDQVISDLLNRSIFKEKVGGAVTLYGKKYGYSFEGRFWEMSLHVYAINEKGKPCNFSDRVKFKLEDYNIASKNNIPIIQEAVSKELQPYIEAAFNKDNADFIAHYRAALTTNNYAEARTLVTNFQNKYKGIYPEFEGQQQGYYNTITAIETEHNSFIAAHTTFF